MGNPGKEGNRALRPTQVSIALDLLYIVNGAWTVLPLNALWALRGQLTRLQFIICGALFLIIGGLYAALVYVMSRRRNWARMASLALFVWAAASGVPDVLEKIPAHPVSSGLYAVTTCLGIIAFWLLFRKESRAWFSRPPV